MNSIDLAHIDTRAVADRVQELLQAAPITSRYRAVLSQALTLPGNVLSHTRDVRWAQLVLVCCTAAGGLWREALTAAAAAELFMVALDILDDLEDCEETPLQIEFGPARTLNISTGLLFLAQTSLLDSAYGTQAASILNTAGTVACSGQHADLQTQAEHLLQIEESLAITERKSATLVSAMCRLGALYGGADEQRQLLYARFGAYLGMVLQLSDDIAGIHPEAQQKPDITLERPTLPLTYANLYKITYSGDNAVQGSDLWTDGPAYLTWAVAEVYRRHALDLIPQLTHDSSGRAALATFLPTLA